MLKQTTYYNQVIQNGKHFEEKEKEKEKTTTEKM